VDLEENNNPPVGLMHQTKQLNKVLAVAQKNEDFTHVKAPPSFDLSPEESAEVESAFDNAELIGDFNLTLEQQQSLLVSRGFRVQKEIIFDGISLRQLALDLYGDATAWKLIYETNKDVIGDDPDNIALGTKLIIYSRQDQDFNVQEIAQKLDVFDIWEKEKVLGIGLQWDFDKQDIVSNANTVDQVAVITGGQNYLQVLQFRLLTPFALFTNNPEYGNFALNQIGRYTLADTAGILEVEFEKALKAESRTSDVRNIVVTKKADSVELEAEVLPVFKDQFETLKKEIIFNGSI